MGSKEKLPTIKNMFGKPTLLKALLDKGMSVDEFVERVGIASSTVDKWLTGNNISSTFRRRIIDALGTDICNLPRTRTFKVKPKEKPIEEPVPDTEQHEEKESESPPVRPQPTVSLDHHEEVTEALEENNLDLRINNRALIEKDGGRASAYVFGLFSGAAIVVAVAAITTGFIRFY